MSVLNGHAVHWHPVPHVIEAALLRLYAEVRPRVGSNYEVPVGDVTLRLMVCTTELKAIEPESLCEQDVYAAVVELERQHGGRVRAKQIIKLLRNSSEPWSDSAVWKALASLCHRNLLNNRHNARGYGTNPERNGES